MQMFVAKQIRGLVTKRAKGMKYIPMGEEYDVSWMRGKTFHGGGVRFVKILQFLSSSLSCWE